MQVTTFTICSLHEYTLYLIKYAYISSSSFDLLHIDYPTLASQNGQNLSRFYQNIAQLCVVSLMKTQDGILRLLVLSKTSPNKSSSLKTQLPDSKPASSPKSEDTDPERSYVQIIHSFIIPILQGAKEVLKDPDAEGYFTEPQIRSREFASNLIHLMHYTTVWSNKKDLTRSYINAFEFEIYNIVECLYTIFDKLEIAHATIPDIRLNVKGVHPAQVLKNMRQLSVYKNGGIFFSLVRVLLKIVGYAKKTDYRRSSLKMLTSLLCKSNKPQKKASPPSMEAVPNTEKNLIMRIENSNQKLAKILKTDNPRGYFESTSSDKISPMRPQVSDCLPFSSYIV